MTSGARKPKKIGTFFSIVMSHKNCVVFTKKDCDFDSFTLTSFQYSMLENTSMSILSFDSETSSF